MTATVVIGAQWGDEGKGKIVHLLAQEADWCARFNGGTNAGHRVVFDRVKKTPQGDVAESEAFAFHLVPSGAIHRGVAGVMGNGMVIDPYALHEEIDLLKAAKGHNDPDLYLSEAAHLLLPYHPVVERLSGSTKALDTTAKGIGPAYRDKVKRVGARVGDLRFPDLFQEKVAHVLEHERRVWGEDPFRDIDAGRVYDEVASLLEPLMPRVTDTGALLNEALDRGEAVCFEGAQACLLDLDFGTYPYVTSSNTTVGGVGTGAGVSPRRLDRVVGVSKAYTTRVGAGPFPTEAHDEAGESLRERGSEYGTTTGRARRCGWLDLVPLRYAARLNGFTELALIKLDVLSGFDELKVAVAYERGGERLENFPAHPHALAECAPVYETLPGWEADISNCRSEDELPRAARDYVHFVEQAVGCPVGLVSVGPGFAENVALR